MAAVSCLELELCNAEQVIATVGNGSLHVTWVDCHLLLGFIGYL